jgi:hypothetical protein
MERRVLTKDYRANSVETVFHSAIGFRGRYRPERRGKYSSHFLCFCCFDTAFEFFLLFFFQDECTTLYRAVQFRGLKAVQELIDHGANVNIQEKV